MTKVSFRYSSAIFALCFFIGFCFLFFFLPPYSQSNGYFGSLAEKHRRLETLKSPKVVLVGGSNLTYSTDSELIEKRLSMPVVNMGSSANVGLRYMLEEVKGQLRPGDIVIFSPEHQLFFGLIDGTKDLFRVVQAYPPSLKWLTSCYILHPENFLALLRNYKELVTAKCRLYYECIFCGKQKDLFNFSEGNKSLDFNDCGDVISHKNSAQTSFTDQEIAPGCNIDGNAIELLQRFTQEKENEGVRFFLVPPPTSDKSFASTSKIVDELYQKLGCYPRIPIIGNRKNYVVSRAWCFDSPYHLLFKYREKRTSRIVADLLPHLSAVPPH